MCLACEAEALWELYLAQRAKASEGKPSAAGDGGGGAESNAGVGETAPRVAPVAAFGCEDPAAE